MYSKSKHCIEHPLGILCRCAEYQSMVESFISYNVGTLNQLLPKVNAESVALAEVSWINNHMKVDEDITKPIIMYPREKSSINARNMDKIWIPVLEDAVSLKSMKISWTLWK